MKLITAALLLSTLSNACVSKPADVDYKYDGEESLSDQELDRKFNKDLAFCNYSARHTLVDGINGLIASRVATDEFAHQECMISKDWDVIYY